MFLATQPILIKLKETSEHTKPPNTIHSLILIDLIMLCNATVPRKCFTYTNIQVNGSKQCYSCDIVPITLFFLSICPVFGYYMLKWYVTRTISFQHCIYIQFDWKNTKLTVKNQFHSKILSTLSHRFEQWLKSIRDI